MLVGERRVLEVQRGPGRKRWPLIEVSFVYVIHSKNVSHPGASVEQEREREDVRAGRRRRGQEQVQVYATHQNDWKDLSAERWRIVGEMRAPARICARQIQMEMGRECDPAKASNG